jgi:arsenate reductase
MIWAMNIVLYGIPNCDTVKKARVWLGERGIDYQFHDFKKQGVPADRLDGWIAQLGWEKLLNRQGTTWRKLDPDVQSRVTDASGAKGVMQVQPSVIKRPVMEWGDRVTVGFDAAAWALLQSR